MANDNLISEVIEILQQMALRNIEITPTTRIFTDLDFDSLQMMQLFEILLDRYGVDFLSAPYSLVDLRTPATLAEALSRNTHNWVADPPT